MDKTLKSLLGGSLILFITFNLFNVINFFFQLMMARMLTPADYGILASLFAFIYMSSVFGEPIQTIIAKYSATEKDTSKLKNLMNRSLKKAIRVALIIFLVFLVVAFPLSQLLKVPYLLLSFTGLMIFAAFMPPITRGLMQGRKRFTGLGINMVIEGIVKIAAAIALVFFGWKVYGAMAGVILGALAAFILSFFAIFDITKAKEKVIKIPDIYSYSKPVFFIILAVLAFFSIDVIIARIVFDGETAGYYAIASTLSKAIFLATQPIGKAMFPLAAEKKNEHGYSLLKNAVVLMLICIAAALLAFYLFPDVLIALFSGRYLPESINILFYLGIAIGLLSLSNLILLYKISRQRVSNYLLFLIFPAIEAVLLFIFSSNLIEFSLAFVTASAIFLWGSIFLLDR